VRYEWDEEKNRINQRKHSGLSFELAIRVFDDPQCLITADRIDSETGEQRWHALGALAAGNSSDLLVLVVHVCRENYDGEDIIRIISARAAGKYDIRRYQKQALD